ncbi:MAG: O-antigen ligase family protein [Planctomycetota bacterium]
MTYVVGQALSRAVGFFMIPVYTRFISPAGYGALDLIELLASIVALTIAMGVADTMSRFYYAEKDDTRRNLIVSTIVIGLAVAAVPVVLLALGISGFLARTVLDAEQYQLCLQIGIATAWFGLLCEIGYSYLRMRYMARSFVTLTLVQLALALSLNIWFIVFLELDILGIVLSTIITQSIVGTLLTVSAALAWNPADAWEQYYVYLTLVVFFVVLVSVIRTPYEIGFMVTCYIVAMSAYLAKSQWEFFVHGQHRYDQGVVRMIGIEPTFGGPNSLAMSIVVSLPMLLFLFDIRKQLTARWTKFWQMAFLGVLAGYALLASTSIVLTNSRSGMVSFIVFVALVVLRGKGLRRKLTAAGAAVALLLLIWVLMPLETQGRFESIWNPEASSRFAAASAQGRIAGAQAGLKMFLQHTLSGVGIGNFVEYRVNQLDRVPLQAHNLLGQILGETGLLGGAAFLLLVGVTLRNCFRIRKATDGLDDPTATVLGRFAVAVQISVILLLFEGLFSHNAYRFNWLWLAAFAVLAVHFALQNRVLQRDVS